MIIADIERLEQRYSRYREDSLLSNINRAALAGTEFAVDEETGGLLNYAQTCYQQSDGLFDITSGVLRKAWDFKSGKIPDNRQVQALLDRVGWQKLNWEPPTLSFPLPGVELDFGGVVKEYAADRAATICQDQGIDHGLVNLGGDIRVIGPRPDGLGWPVGIRDPSNKQGAASQLNLGAGALASSGDYERCITLDGARYGHVLNPKTGWPVKHMASVSVIADLCTVAGSASTIAMLKEDTGPQWLEQMGLPSMWIDVEGKAGYSNWPEPVED